MKLGNPNPFKKKTKKPNSIPSQATDQLTFTLFFENELTPDTKKLEDSLYEERSHVDNKRLDIFNTMSNTNPATTYVTRGIHTEGLAVCGNSGIALPVLEQNTYKSGDHDQSVVITSPSSEMLENINRQKFSAENLFCPDNSEQANGAIITDYNAHPRILLQEIYTQHTSSDDTDSLCPPGEPGLTASYKHLVVPNEQYDYYNSSLLKKFLALKARKPSAIFEDFKAMLRGETTPKTLRNSTAQSLKVDGKNKEQEEKPFKVIIVSQQYILHKKFAVHMPATLRYIQQQLGLYLEFLCHIDQILKDNEKPQTILQEDDIRGLAFDLEAFLSRPELKLDSTTKNEWIGIVKAIQGDPKQDKLWQLRTITQALVKEYEKIIGGYTVNREHFIEPEISESKTSDLDVKINHEPVCYQSVFHSFCQRLPDYRLELLYNAFFSRLKELNWADKLSNYLAMLDKMDGIAHEASDIKESPNHTRVRGFVAQYQPLLARLDGLKNINTFATFVKTQYNLFKNSQDPIEKLLIHGLNQIKIIVDELAKHNGLNYLGNKKHPLSITAEQFISIENNLKILQDDIDFRQAYVFSLLALNKEITSNSSHVNNEAILQKIALSINIALDGPHTINEEHTKNAIKLIFSQANAEYTQHIPQHIMQLNLYLNAIPENIREIIYITLLQQHLTDRIRPILNTQQAYDEIFALAFEYYQLISETDKFHHYFHKISLNILTKLWKGNNHTQWMYTAIVLQLFFSLYPNTELPEHHPNLLLISYIFNDEKNPFIAKFDDFIINSDGIKTHKALSNFSLEEITTIKTIISQSKTIDEQLKRIINSLSTNDKDYKARDFTVSQIIQLKNCLKARTELNYQNLAEQLIIPTIYRASKAYINNLGNSKGSIRNASDKFIKELSEDRTILLEQKPEILHFIETMLYLTEVAYRAKINGPNSAQQSIGSSISKLNQLAGYYNGTELARAYNQLAISFEKHFYTILFDALKKKQIEEAKKAVQILLTSNEKLIQEDIDLSRLKQLRNDTRNLAQLTDNQANLQGYIQANITKLTLLYMLRKALAPILKDQSITETLSEEDKKAQYIVELSAELAKQLLIHNPTLISEFCLLMKNIGNINIGRFASFAKLKETIEAYARIYPKIKAIDQLIKESVEQPGNNQRFVSSCNLTQSIGEIPIQPGSTEIIISETIIELTQSSKTIGNAIAKLKTFANTQEKSGEVSLSKTFGILQTHLTSLANTIEKNHLIKCQVFLLLLLEEVNHQTKGYVIETVIDHDNSAFGVFGLTHNEAYNLLVDEISEIKDLISQLIIEALLTHEFHQFLQQKNIQIRHSVDELVDDYNNGGKKQLFDYVNNTLDSDEAYITNIGLAYLEYDLQANNRGNNNVHIHILRAIAHSQKTNLYFWEKKDNNQIIPYTTIDKHNNKISYTYRSSDAESTTHLLIDGDRFDKVVMKGYGDLIPEEPISSYSATIKSNQTLGPILGLLKRLVNSQPSTSLKTTFQSIRHYLTEKLALEQAPAEMTYTINSPRLLLELYQCGLKHESIAMQKYAYEVMLREFNIELAPSTIELIELFFPSKPNKHFLRNKKLWDVAHEPNEHEHAPDILIYSNHDETNNDEINDDKREVTQKPVFCFIQTTSAAQMANLHTVRRFCHKNNIMLIIHDEIEICRYISSQMSSQMPKYRPSSLTYTANSPRLLLELYKYGVNNNLSFMENYASTAMLSNFNIELHDSTTDLVDIFLSEKNFLEKKAHLPTILVYATEKTTHVFCYIKQESINDKLYYDQVRNHCQDKNITLIIYNHRDMKILPKIFINPHSIEQYKIILGYAHAKKPGNSRPWQEIYNMLTIYYPEVYDEYRLDANDSIIIETANNNVENILNIDLSIIESDEDNIDTKADDTNDLQQVFAITSMHCLSVINNDEDSDRLWTNHKFSYYQLVNIMLIYKSKAHQRLNNQEPHDIETTIRNIKRETVYGLFYFYYSIIALIHEFGSINEWIFKEFEMQNQRIDWCLTDDFTITTFVKFIDNLCRHSVFTNSQTPSITAIIQSAEKAQEAGKNASVSMTNDTKENKDAAKRDAEEKEVINFVHAHYETIFFNTGLKLANLSDNSFFSSRVGSGGNVLTQCNQSTMLQFDRLHDVDQPSIPTSKSLIGKSLYEDEDLTTNKTHHFCDIYDNNLSSVSIEYVENPGTNQNDNRSLSPCSKLV